MRILLYLLVGYLILVGIITLIQKRMLYFPDPAPPSVDNLHSAGGPTLAIWPAGSGAAFRGYVSAKPMAAALTRGVVVVFHGNAGSARDRGYYLAALEPRGYRVILAEYPGYGGRPGELSESSFVADGRETARQALEEFGGPLWLWGESLGAGVAAAVANDRTLPVAGVALITPWDSLPNLAQALYWYLPVRWLLRDRYDNQANLSQYSGPVAILVAERDEIIPARHSQSLYEALREPKRRWIFPDAGHNSWPAHPTAAWWDETLDWLHAAPR